MYSMALEDFSLVGMSLSLVDAGRVGVTRVEIHQIAPSAFAVLSKRVTADVCDEWIAHRLLDDLPIFEILPDGIETTLRCQAVSVPLDTAYVLALSIENACLNDGWKVSDRDAAVAPGGIERYGDQIGVHRFVPAAQMYGTAASAKRRSAGAPHP